MLPSTKELLDSSSTSAKSKQKKQAVNSANENATESFDQNDPAAKSSNQIKIYLNYKRYVYDEKKKLVQ